MDNSSFKKLDLGIISNTLTETHRRLVANQLGDAGEGGFFSPLKFSHQELQGEVVLVDVLSADTLTRPGFGAAQKYVRNAVDYLAARGAGVIAFTAAMKRPPGKDGAIVKAAYPGISFTIGDNGTMLSILTTLSRHLNHLDKKDKIAVMGAGFLGEAIIKHLLDWGSRNLTVFTGQKLDLPKIVRTVPTFEEIGVGIKLFLSCTHKNNGSISPESFRNALAPDCVILDAAVPAGVGKELANCLPPTVQRCDIGDYYLRCLDYSFDPALLQFPIVGLWYGCFTEAIAIAYCRQKGGCMGSYDFFRVNDSSMTAVEIALRGLPDGTVFIPQINFQQEDQLELINYPF